jgi:crotonobetainyl-CoA:carnitine CoA-transferase CaiB-like acyl-CoA transferase
MAENHETPPEGPLAGVRVLELGTVLAVPAAGMWLAELGATVQKAEPPEGDVTRGWRLAGEAAADGRSAYFTAVNWGKVPCQLDLKTLEGQTLLKTILGETDILLTNAPTETARRLGLLPAQTVGLHPQLIHLNLTGYGQGDPRPGFDAVVQAEAGFQYLNRSPGQAPQKMPVALMDLMAAHQLRETVLLALLRRTQTGRGGYWPLTLMGAALSSLANQASAWLWAQRVPEPLGSEHPSIVPYGAVYQAADGAWLLLAVGTDRQFAALAAVLGQPDWARDPRFAVNAQRVVHREVLGNLLATAIAPKPRHQWLEALEAAQVPVAAVRTIPEALELPQAEALRLKDPTSGQAALRTLAFDYDAQQLSDFAPWMDLPPRLPLNPPTAWGLTPG